MEGLSKFRPHLHVKVFLLLQAFFSCFDSILDNLLELDTLDRVELVCNTLAVEAVPVAFIREVPEGGCRGLGQLKIAFHDEALNLRQCCLKNLVPANVLKGITND